MKWNTRRLVFVYYFLFRRTFKKNLLRTDNFDFFNLKLNLFNEDLYDSSHRFVKLLNILNFSSRIYLGKTVDLNSLSSVNALSLNLFSKSKISNPIISSYFLNKTKLRELGANSFILLVGCSVRVEEPLLNLFLRKLSVEKGGLFFNIGSRLSSNFYVKQVGGTIKTFLKFIDGRHWLTNVYLKSLSSLFLFGAGSRSLVNLFFKRGLGVRNNDLVFFPGVSPSTLLSIILGYNEHPPVLNKNISSLSFDFACNALLGESVVRNRFLICFDHNFTRSNRSLGDLIIPQRNFVEKKGSIFINLFGEILRNKCSFVRDVDKLFSSSYKKSYDSMVYDSRILHFGSIRSRFLSGKLNSWYLARLKIFQSDPLLFFSLQHLYNTLDHMVIMKLLHHSGAVIAGKFFIFDAEGDFCLNDDNDISSHMNTPYNIKWDETITRLDLNTISLVNNRVYFDPENDVFSNSSSLLLKTYKRMVIQLSNF